ncbi:MAG: hypothetical protein HFJ04_09290 [Lachnospiraceae bacterium]|nr:hypothetical protein [Lachnospiraceae bacterium]
MNYKDTAKFVNHISPKLIIPTHDSRFAERRKEICRTCG